MSRTWTHKPYEWWKRYHAASWRLNCGYPGAFTGAWIGLHWYANRRNRQQRRWYNMAMGEYRKRHEADVWEAPERKFPRSVKWDIY